MRSSAGELVPGRCRAVNLCAYCARLAAVENAEVLSIDAMTGTPPVVWAVLTTRTATLETEPFYRSREAVQRALARRWPDGQYAAIVEFTTGYGPRSGGARRPHWNLLLKGVPADALDQVRDVIARVWCERVDATPDAQFVGTVNEAGGLMRYLALHFQKSSQAPPHGWRGTRFTHSRGYFAEGIKTVRAQARADLRHKRRVHKIEERAGGTLTAQELADWLAVVEPLEDGVTWELVRVQPEVSDPRLPRREAARRPFKASGRWEPGPAAPRPARASQRESTAGRWRAPA